MEPGGNISSNVHSFVMVIPPCELVSGAGLFVHPGISVLRVTANPVSRKAHGVLDRAVELSIPGACQEAETVKAGVMAYRPAIDRLD